MQLKEVDIAYVFYLNEFCCGGEETIPSSEFEKFVGRAKLELSSLGVKFLEKFELEIKLCVCDVAEELYLLNSKRGKNSETIEGYSVTYAEMDTRKSVLKIALKRLEHTGLLYAGVE